MRKLKGLVLTSIDKSGSTAEQIQTIIQRSLLEAGVEPLLFDDVVGSRGQPGAYPRDVITKAIQEADVVIADVTDQNPNVLYELGYTHALRKPTLLLVDTDAAEGIPANLAGFNIITYDANSHDALAHRIRRAVQAQTERLKTAS